VNKDTMPWRTLCMNLWRPAILTGVFFIAGCAAEVPVPKVSLVDDRQLLTDAQDEAVEQLALKGKPVADTAPTPPAKAAIPAPGETTSYGAAVTADLSAGFKNIYAGEHTTAVGHLEKVLATQPITANMQFEANFALARSYIAAGKFDAAETVIERIEQQEIQLFRTNVNSQALLGEARFWASDLDSALVILGKVAAETKHWKLPTSYGGPPTNLPELFNLTTAQLRAYTVLATIHLAQNDFETAADWANLAESGYKDVFYVAHHPLYGPFVPTHADSYYGRAMNLAVVGAVKLVIEQKRGSSDAYFAAATAFLDAIDFVTPKLTVSAIRAQALLAAGMDAEAATLAKRVAGEAAAAGVADLVWRIEALRGEALLKQGDVTGSEIAFRAAQAAVETVTGRLTTDRAKRRFGIGKETITQRLAEADIRKQDFGALFVDLERGRARAFVDMMAGQSVAIGRQQLLKEQVTAIDEEIREVRLRVSAESARSTDRAASKSKLANLIEARKIRILSLRAQDSELADVFSIASVTLQDAQNSLRAGELLLYGIASEADQPIRWLVVTQNDARVETLAITHSQLRKQLRLFRKSIGETATTQRSLLSSIEESLGIAKWRQFSAVHIVPTGQLYFVPWGALDIKQPVGVLPTGGWVARKERTVGNATAAVVGDPDFFGKLPQLAGARIEAEEVGAKYRTSPLVGADATPDALRRKVGSGVKVLHIATHATFEARAPLDSALILSGQNGIVELTAASIFENPFAAEIVVLSACETGVGRAVAGDDFLGLPRSFYIGGARTVLNSLWPVEDEGTLEFMKAFHANLSGGNIGAAWLKARNRLKEQGYAPSVYGAFVVGGSLGG